MLEPKHLLLESVLLSEKQTYHRIEDTKIVLGTMSRQEKMRKEPEKAGGVMRLQHKSEVSEGGEETEAC